MQNNLPIILKELLNFSNKDAQANAYTEHYECFGVSLYKKGPRNLYFNWSHESETKRVLSENCKPYHEGDYKYIYCNNCPMDCNTDSLNYIK